jgi:GT2 family glycosyltransferase
VDPKVSIIIVNWNTKDCLRSCLKSIYGKVVNVSFEIIIVDNVSTDGSQKMVKKEFPKVKLMLNKENVGFGRACNQAAKGSKGKYLLILNPDTEIIVVVFQDLFNLLEKDHSIGAVIPTVFDSFGNLKSKTIRTIPTPIVTFGYIYPQFGWLTSKRSQPLSLNKAQEHQFPPGFCFFIKASIFKELDGFDEYFFLYFEDTDLGVRLRKIGLKIISYPGFKILHEGARATYKNINVRDLSWHKSALYFFKKTSGIKGYLKMKILLVFGAIGDIAFVLIKYLRKRNLNINRQAMIIARLRILWWHLSNVSCGN